MKELIPKDEYGVFADAKDIARVDSLFVAEFLAFYQDMSPLPKRTGLNPRDLGHFCLLLPIFRRFQPVTWTAVKEIGRVCGNLLASALINVLILLAGGVATSLGDDGIVHAGLY